MFYIDWPRFFNGLFLKLTKLRIIVQNNRSITLQISKWVAKSSCPIVDKTRNHNRHKFIIQINIELPN